MKNRLTALLLTLIIVVLSLCGCSATMQTDTQQTTQSVSSATSAAEQTTKDAASEEETEYDTEEYTATEKTKEVTEKNEQTEKAKEAIAEDGEYTSRDEVALYIHTYGRLPSNFITKKAAQKLGWDAKQNKLSDVARGKSIGGDRFGNYEGLLPEGESYRECDINYKGGKRGAERIIFSDSGKIYYTADHYKTFEELY